VGRLDGKVALITGGARGQGAAAARLFAAEGARVAIADVLDEEAKRLAEEIGGAALALHLDVASEDDWQEAVAACERAFGRLDVLVNNAGILRILPIERTTLEEYLRVVAVNQVGVFLGIRAAAPAMRRAGGGSIINVSSVEGLRGGPGLIAYSATKFAVRGMTMVAAVELGPDRIRVNSVHPGVIDTPMTRGMGLAGVDMDRLFAAVPLGRAGTPEDVAQLEVFLASDESAYCTGAAFVCDGGAVSFIGWGGYAPR
jgi:3alpha(or 20beta)-hydroxysteroid dehydrogenase